MNYQKRDYLLRRQFRLSARRHRKPGLWELHVPHQRHSRGRWMRSATTRAAFRVVSARLRRARRLMEEADAGMGIAYRGFTLY